MKFEWLTSDSPDSEIAHRVYQLRRRIYVDEMKSPPTFASDEFDARSRLFLLTLEGEDAGTVRLTDRSNGNLELEGQHPTWASTVASDLERGTSICELTRLMLIPKVRGGPALGSLLLGVLATMDITRPLRVYAAGRIGGLSRLYQGLGFSLRLNEPVDYCIGNTLLGKYELLCVDHQQVSCMRQILARKIRAASGRG